MYNRKRRGEYARQASNDFVKSLAQRSVLGALGNKWHSRFALDPRSTTIRLRIKQGMAARADTHCASARLTPCERMSTIAARAIGRVWSRLPTSAQYTVRSLRTDD